MTVDFIGPNQSMTPDRQPVTGARPFWFLRYEQCARRGAIMHCPTGIYCPGCQTTHSRCTVGIDRPGVGR